MLNVQRSNYFNSHVSYSAYCSELVNLRDLKSIKKYPLPQ